MNCKHVRVIRGLKSVRTSRRDFEITLKKIRESLDRAWEVLGSLDFEYCGFEPFLRRKKRAISAWRIVVGAFEKNEILTGARVIQPCKSNPMAVFSILCLIAIMQGFMSALFISFP